MDISIQVHVLSYDMLSTFTSKILLRNIVKKGETFYKHQFVDKHIDINYMFASICNRYAPCDNFLILHSYYVIRILHITIENTTVLMGLKPPQG